MRYGELSSSSQSSLELMHKSTACSLRHTSSSGGGVGSGLLTSNGQVKYVSNIASYYHEVLQCMCSFLRQTVVSTILPSAPARSHVLNLAAEVAQQPDNATATAAATAAPTTEQLAWLSAAPQATQATVEARSFMRGIQAASRSLLRAERQAKAIALHEAAQQPAINSSGHVMPATLAALCSCTTPASSEGVLAAEQQHAAQQQHRPSTAAAAKRKHRAAAAAGRSKPTNQKKSKQQGDSCYAPAQEAGVAIQL